MNTLKWVQSFLRNRTQRVLVDGECSDTCPVKSGVPQGTVLGPLLLLLYINDIGLNSKVRLFADDCLVYREINSQQDCDTLQQDLDKLHTWSKEWQMAFYVTKSFIMSTTLARLNIFHHEYKMAGSALQLTPSSPYLGVQLNNKMSWNTHVDYIVAKANRSFGFLRRNLYRCPSKINEITYSTMVRPR